MTVEIRVATPQDARGILAIYAPFCTSSHVSFEVVPPTEEQMRERVARITRKYPWLIGEVDGEVDGEVGGYVYASQHRERAAYRWAVDVAVYVAESQQRRNLGRALYSTLFAILREQGYFQAYAGIALPNAGSVGLHEAVGFQPVTVFPNVGYKLGRWLDVGWWQLQLRSEIDNPPDPRPFREIRDEPVIAAAMRDGARLVRAPS
ncbi:MAG: N-acetyltransferase family protein [Planctomycetes bacterium]|nr:N-acetyltransferase family protein [Planctomycetota bacterium]